MCPAGTGVDCHVGDRGRSDCSRVTMRWCTHAWPYAGGRETSTAAPIGHVIRRRRRHGTGSIWVPWRISIRPCVSASDRPRRPSIVAVTTTSDRHAEPQGRGSVAGRFGRPICNVVAQDLAGVLGVVGADLDDDAVLAFDRHAAALDLIVERRLHAERPQLGLGDSASPSVANELRAVGSGWASESSEVIVPAYQANGRRRVTAQSSSIARGSKNASSARRDVAVPGEVPASRSGPFGSHAMSYTRRTHRRWRWP